jgi:dTDP-4-dehydrorhamnose reductase
VKVLVTGAGGMLGRDVVTVADGMGHDVVGLSHDDLDITDPGRVERVILRERPGAVINCAAWTAVDDAEGHEGEASLVNAEGAGVVADAAAKAGAKVLYLSTDYVFDGTKNGPYTESDETDPINAYGRTKLAGERATALVTKQSFIVRTAWVFGPGRENFVETMLRLGEGGGPVVVVHDQLGSPTYTGHLAIGLVRLIDSSAFGIHHMAGEGGCSRYEWAMEIFRQSGVVTRVLASTTEMMEDRAKRPTNSVLASGREAPIRLPPWQRGVADYLARRSQPAAEEQPRKRTSGSRRQPVLELRPKPAEEEVEEQGPEGEAAGEAPQGEAAAGEQAPDDEATSREPGSEPGGAEAEPDRRD